MRSKRILYALFSVALSVGFFLVAAETVTRVYLGSDPGNSGHLLENKKIRIGFKGNRGDESVFIENNTPVVKGVKVHINKVGLRGHESSFEKPAETTRIALFGDSFTFGHGVEDYETLSTQLQRTLSSKPEFRKKVEVLNFGVQGFNTTQEYIYLSRFGIRFQPDVAILVWLYNDFHRRGYDISDLPNLAAGEVIETRVGRMRTERRRRNAEASFSLTGWLREHSDFYGFILAPKVKFLVAAQFGLDDLSNDADYTDFSLPGAKLSLASIRYAAKFCQEHAIRFGVVVFPALQALDIRYYQDNIYAKMQAFCQQNGIPVLNLFDVYKNKDESRLVVSKRDGHPNGDALRLAANAMSDWILKNNARMWEQVQ